MENQKENEGKEGGSPAPLPVRGSAAHRRRGGHTEKKEKLIYN